MYLLDASVLVKWLIVSDSVVKQIEEFLTHENVSSIPLVEYELRNALRYNLINESDIDKALLAYSKMNLTILNLGEDEMNSAVYLARIVNDTFYDTLYHSTAITRGLIFTTFDKKYFNKAKHLGSILYFPDLVE